MARKKKTDGAEQAGDAAAPDKKRSNLVPALIVAGGLILGAKLMGGGGGGAVAAAPATTTTTIEHPGPVVKLAPITLNLADGRFLRVGIALQKPAEEEGAAAEGEGEGAAEPDPADAAGTYAKALDIVIRVLGRGKYEELVSAEGRKAAKEQLRKDLEVAYPEEIEDVYFTEFVLQ